MPKVPVQATFVRSRAALALYCLIAGAMALACALWVSLIWAGVVLVVLVALGWQQAGRVPPPLRIGDGGHWEQYCRGQWQSVTIRASRVGPLLCEVIIEGRRYALWYDMLPPGHFRRLRRALLNTSSKEAALEETV
ncbi:hypothetical protein SAMN05421848_2232 [Kushneria avicenniae]|uniref:Toxin CptA n=1 Tax=Kushneria avicenniae TaxID=402385 RepID=A0A1I1KWX1_9GAMM|nr:hypothetical protein [Kushneria avicenniae]SFC65316.1 hypothetical protein SAMN05421848_2232 [Kushneria avicenniae]